jgi:hypothetical protein
MPSGVTLVFFYCSLIYHSHALIFYFTQIYPVHLILSIFSFYLRFHCCLIDSVLIYLSNFLICLSTFYSTFFFTLHCVYLEIFMNPGVVYMQRCIRYRLGSF